MNEKSKLGLGVIDAALVLGMLGDALLRVTPWGLNILLWIVVLVLAAAVLVRWRGVELKGEGAKLLLPVVLSAAVFAWRDSPVLKGLDGLALVLALALAAGRTRSGRIVVAGVTEYVREIFAAMFNAAFGAWPLLRSDVCWKDVPRGGWSGNAAAIGRGLIIAVPLLFVFGGLLMAADAVFARIINNVFQIDLPETFLHIFVTLACAWLVCGFLRGALLKNESTNESAKNASTGSVVPVASIITIGINETASDKAKVANNDALSRLQAVSLGIVELGIGLGLLAALFFCFVIVQFRYFFGGASMVQISMGMTYAEYARRGFFELVTVAALVLPLLLIAHYLLRKEKAAHERIFRSLAGILLALLFVIMASAIVRMRLYQQEYGLTELRVYTMAFMGWLALVFVWFAWTVLRGRRERFAFGALIACFFVVAALHLFNPDAFIVRANVSHAARVNQKLDTGYATSLSADAVPVLIESLPSMKTADARIVAAYVLERWSKPLQIDYRAWSVSRGAAWSTTQKHAADLRAFRDEAKESLESVSAVRPSGAAAR
ncbi:MAG: DUF4153 domain-containing protein [Pyrinomonadaceae bacterium]